MRISDWSSDVCSSDLIVEVAERRAGVAVRQKEIPQARGLRLVLRAFEQFELPRRPAPAIGAGFAQPEEFFGDRIDIVGDMALDGVEERLRFLRHAQVVEFGLKFDFGHVGLRGILPEKVSGAPLSMTMIEWNSRYSPNE